MLFPPFRVQRERETEIAKELESSSESNFDSDGENGAQIREMEVRET